MSMASTRNETAARWVTVVVAMIGAVVSTWMAYISTQAAEDQRSASRPFPVLLDASPGSHSLRPEGSGFIQYCEMRVRLANIHGVRTHLVSTHLELSIGT